MDPKPALAPSEFSAPVSWWGSPSAARSAATSRRSTTGAPRSGAITRQRWRSFRFASVALSRAACRGASVTGNAEPEKARFGSFFGLLRIPSLRSVTLFVAVATFGLFLVYTWLPTFLYDKFHLSLARAGFEASVYPRRSDRCWDCSRERPSPIDLSDALRPRDSG